VKADKTSALEVPPAPRDCEMKLDNGKAKDVADVENGRHSGRDEGSGQVERQGMTTSNYFEEVADPSQLDNFHCLQLRQRQVKLVLISRQMFDRLELLYLSLLFSSSLFLTNAALLSRYARNRLLRVCTGKEQVLICMVHASYDHSIRFEKRLQWTEEDSLWQSLRLCVLDCCTGSEVAVSLHSISELHFTMEEFALWRKTARRSLKAFYCPSVVRTMAFELRQLEQATGERGPVLIGSAK
jgi:hypothetical protein